MARRSRSKSKSSGNISNYILIGIVVIAALIAGKYFLNQRSQHFADITELSISDLKNNANSLSGNSYRISGKISEKLKWTSNKGQILSLSVEHSQNESGIIPIMVPANISSINLERGQSYIFKIEVNREGLPIAADVKAL